MTDAAYVPPTYRRKPDLVEAFQWNPANAEEMQTVLSWLRQRVVWKFELESSPTATGRVFVDMPADAECLSVGLQRGSIVVWALVDPDYTPEQGYMANGPRRLIVANTGAPIPGFPEGAKFLGTVTSENGIVWHVWDGDAETTA